MRLWKSWPVLIKNKAYFFSIPKKFKFKTDDMTSLIPAKLEKLFYFNLSLFMEYDFSKN